jgi:predicted transcriptional regulator
MSQWNLATEPYLFVLDGSGRVAAQFEGIVEHDEVAAVLDRLLKG